MTGLWGARRPQPSPRREHVRPPTPSPTIVTLEVESVGRLDLNVFQPMLQTPSGMASFFRGLRGRKLASSALMAPVTRAFVRGAERFVEAEGVNLILFQRAERRDDRTPEPLRQWPGSEVLLYLNL